jgi:hypothetical protein
MFVTVEKTKLSREILYAFLALSEPCLTYP